MFMKGNKTVLKKKTTGEVGLTVWKHPRHLYNGFKKLQAAARSV